MKMQNIFDIQNDTASVTHVGLIRRENEDNLGFAETPNGRVFVVCDGMGGHVGGKQASALAVEAIIKFMGSGVYGNITAAMEQAIKYANQVVFEAAEKNPNLRGMGTTVVMAVVKEDKIYIAHVGDSRIYLLSDNQLYRLTKDHSLVQELFDRGIISNEEMKHHSRKNEITKALGLGPGVEPEVNPEPLLLKNGDKLLLCSDGLSDMVDDLVIREVLIKHGSDVKSASKELLNIALNNGGKDNITFQLIHITNSNYKESVFKDRSNEELPAQAGLKYDNDTEEILQKQERVHIKKGRKLSKKIFLPAVVLIILIAGWFVFGLMSDKIKSSGEKQFILFNRKKVEKTTVEAARKLLKSKKENRLYIIPVDPNKNKYITLADSLEAPGLKSGDTIVFFSLNDVETFYKLPEEKEAKEYIVKKEDLYFLKKSNDKPQNSARIKAPSFDNNPPKTGNSEGKKDGEIFYQTMAKNNHKKLKWENNRLLFKKNYLFNRNKVAYSSVDELIDKGIIENLPDKLLKKLGGKDKTRKRIMKLNKIYFEEIRKELSRQKSRKKIQSLKRDIIIYIKK